jgi:hypothetical protein
MNGVSLRLLVVLVAGCLAVACGSDEAASKGDVAGAVDTLPGLDGAAGVDAALDTALPDGGEVVPTGDAVPDGAQPGDTLTADGAETLDVEAPADADVKHPACYPNCLTPEGYVWVTIPGGSFQMGCTAGDADCNPDELPAHQVTLASFDLL